MLKEFKIGDIVMPIKGIFPNLICEPAEVKRIDKGFLFKLLLEFESGQQFWFPEDYLTKYCKHKANAIKQGKVSR